MLLNDKEIHNINIKLNKNKPRELRFRLYLDNMYKDGINRKEAILRLFEGTANIDMTQLNKDAEELTEVKQNTDVDISAFKNI